jgi:hypothetical protein
MVVAPLLHVAQSDSFLSHFHHSSLYAQSVFLNAWHNGHVLHQAKHSKIEYIPIISIAGNPCQLTKVLSCYRTSPNFVHTRRFPDLKFGELSNLPLHVPDFSNRITPREPVWKAWLEGTQGG